MSLVLEVSGFGVVGQIVVKGQTEILVTRVNDEGEKQTRSTEVSVDP